MTRRLLEICVDHLDDVRIAANAGADRIELCAALDVGGTTPPVEIMRAARDATSLPIMTMIRPRGGDFIYSADELGLMEDAVDAAKANGADGVVFGCLTTDGAVAVDAVRRLVDRARPLPITFHRAFDEAADPHAAFEAIVDLGIERLLTSGQARVAPAGVDLIRDLIHRAEGRIIVMPGCGLRAANVRDVADATGAIELHGSGSTGGRTDATEVAAMRLALD